MSGRRGQRKVEVRIDRSLTEPEFKLLERIEPATVRVMLRQRVHLTNYSSIGLGPWLQDNTTGLYYQPTNAEIWFEKEDDLILFVAAYQGYVSAGRSR